MSARAQEGGVPASRALATVAGLAIGPWLLYGLLIPGGNAGWVGLGLDALAMVLLAACRGRKVPLYRPVLVRLALAGVALSAILRFLVFPFTLGSPAEPELAPTLEAMGESLEATLIVLAAITYLHLLASAAFALLLGISFAKAPRPG